MPSRSHLRPASVLFTSSDLLGEKSAKRTTVKAVDRAAPGGGRWSGFGGRFAPISTQDLPSGLQNPHSRVGERLAMEVGTERPDVLIRHTCLLAIQGAYFDQSVETRLPKASNDPGPD